MTAQSAFRLTRRVSRCRPNCSTGLLSYRRPPFGRNQICPTISEPGDGVVGFASGKAGRSGVWEHQTNARSRGGGGEGKRLGTKMPARASMAVLFVLSVFITGAPGSFGGQRPRGASQGGDAVADPEGTGRARWRHSGNPVTATIAASSRPADSLLVCESDAGARVGETRTRRRRRSGAASGARTASSRG